MGIKDYFVRKMVEQKMKEVPKEDQDKIVKLMQDHPELFQKIALEVQGQISQGKSQMDAMMHVMKNHESELKDILGK